MKGRENDFIDSKGGIFQETNGLEYSFIHLIALFGWVSVCVC